MRQSRPDPVLPRLYTFALWKKENNLYTLFFLKFGIASEEKGKQNKYGIASEDSMMRVYMAS